MVRLVAVVAALLALPHPAGGDERDELGETRRRRRLGQVEAALRDTRADAGAVAAALAAADQAVAGARARLATATAELATQVRGAHMTGNVTGLAVVVQANDLRDPLERAVTLSYVIAADQDVLRRLEVARKRAAQLHGVMVRAERAKAFWQANGWC
jgi:septal ring factor EnvC (AmiA/AmiB activator)